MSTEPIRLAVAGAAGRMGRAVLGFAAGQDGVRVTAALVSDEDRVRFGTVRAGDADIPAATSLTDPCDVLIDFTTASGTMTWLKVCRARRIPMVIGATGHTEEQVAAIASAAHEIPIVKASNLSVGMQTMRAHIGAIVQQLGRDYDVEIVETHHRYKVDAPSGTALSLVDDIAHALNRTRDDVIFGRSGRTGERPRGQIGVHALRMGEVVGRHEIHISGPGETLSIIHTAHSRKTFAAGALRAAAWVVRRAPGLYAMKDVLGTG